MNIADKKILQRNLAKFLVDDVFNTITDDDVIEVITPTKWRYKDKELTAGQILALRNQATVFYRSDLWKILKDELRYLAQKKAMEKAQTEEDIFASKMLMYLTDVIDSRLKKMVQDK